MREKIEEVGKSSTGVLTKAGSHTLRKTIFHFVKTHVKAKANKEREKLTYARSNHVEKRIKADVILLAKGTNYTNRCGIDLKDVLGAMKTRDNRYFPKLKADLFTFYIEWKGENCACIVFNEAAHVLAMEAEIM